MSASFSIDLQGAAARPARVSDAAIGSGNAASPSAALPGNRAMYAGRLLLAILDVAIALGRKIGGFCALLTLGWIYFRLLVLGQSPHDLYPGAPDPDLRQTLWVALLLVMAQGWDITTDEIARCWAQLGTLRPARLRAERTRDRSVLARLGAPLEPVVVRLGRFMDLCVAIANKVGALAVLGYLGFLAWEFTIGGATARALYPVAHDPSVSLLADICVYVVVLGWWAMPFEQISLFWRRLRGDRRRP